MRQRIEQSDELDALFDEWAAPACPDDFADRVVDRALREHRVPAGGARRGVVIPLLLVAMLISVGAWAGLEGRARFADAPSLNRDPADSDGGMSPLKVPAVSFQWMMDTSHAEPEAELEPVAPVARQNVRAPEVPGEEAPARPRVVHFPRCECGTSGIVCACSD